jgi:hypothetical protein
VKSGKDEKGLKGEESDSEFLEAASENSLKSRRERLKFTAYGAGFWGGYSVKEIYYVAILFYSAFGAGVFCSLLLLLRSFFCNTLDMDAHRLFSERAIGGQRQDYMGAGDYFYRLVGGLDIFIGPEAGKKNKIRALVLL